MTGYTWSNDLAAVDIDELFTLYRLAPLGDWSPSALRTVFGNSMFTCFAYANDDLAGAGRVLADGLDCAYIAHVAVHPAHQGRGLGTEIIRRLAGLARGHKKIILYANPGTEGFYTRLGFLRMNTAMAIWHDPARAMESGLLQRSSLYLGGIRPGRWHAASMTSSRRLVSSGSPLEPEIGFSRAVRAGSYICVAGTAPIAEGGDTAAPGDVYAQSVRCLDIAEQALQEAGASLADVVRTRVMLTDIGQWRQAARAHAQRFAQVRPVTTFVEVSRFVDPEWLVEFELDAIVSD